MSLHTYLPVIPSNSSNYLINKAPTQAGLLDEGNQGTPREEALGWCISVVDNINSAYISSPASIGINSPMSVSFNLKGTNPYFSYVNGGFPGLKILKNGTSLEFRNAGYGYGNPPYLGVTIPNYDFNNWHEVTFTFNGNGTPEGIKAYVDGNLVTVNYIQRTGTVAESTLPACTVVLAGTAYYSNVCGGNAEWDAQEVLARYKNKTYVPGKTHFFFRLDEGYDTVLYKSFGTGNYTGVMAGVTSTMWYNGSDVPHSWHNELGYGTESLIDINFESAIRANGHSVQRLYTGAKAGIWFNWTTGNINVTYKGTQYLNGEVYTDEYGAKFVMFNGASNYSQISLASDYNAAETTLVCDTANNFNIGYSDLRLNDLLSVMATKYGVGQNLTAIKTIYDNNTMSTADKNSIDALLPSGKNYSTFYNLGTEPQSKKDTAISNELRLVTAAYFVGASTKTEYKVLKEDMALNCHPYWSAAWSGYDLSKMRAKLCTVNTTGPARIYSIKAVNKVFIPRNESSTLLDMMGNKLTFNGRAKVTAALKESNGGYLDGTHKVEWTNNGLPDLPADEFIVSFWVKRNAINATGIETILSYKYNQGTQGGSNSSGFSIMFDNMTTSTSRLAIVTATSTGYVETFVTNSAFTSTDPHHISVIFSSTGFRVILNKLDLINTTFSPITYRNTIYKNVTVGSGYKGMLYGLEVATYSDRNVTNARLGNIMDNHLFFVPMSEGSGIPFNTTYWRIGALSGNEATFWSKKQNNFHYNLLKGFSKYTYRNYYLAEDIGKKAKWAYNSNEWGSTQDCEMVDGDNGELHLVKNTYNTPYFYYFGFNATPLTYYTIKFDAQLVTPTSGVSSVACQILMGNNYTNTNNITGTLAANTWSSQSATLVCGSSLNSFYPGALCIKTIATSMAAGEIIKIKNIKIELYTGGATYIPASTTRLTKAYIGSTTYTSTFTGLPRRLNHAWYPGIQEGDKCIAEFIISEAPHNTEFNIGWFPTWGLNLYPTIIPGTKRVGVGSHRVEFTMPKYTTQTPIIKTQVGGAIAITLSPGTYATQRVVMDEFKVYLAGPSYTDVLGEPLSNPPGAYNSPETKVDYSGVINSPNKVQRQAAYPALVSWAGEEIKNPLFMRKHDDRIDRVQVNPQFIDYGVQSAFVHRTVYKPNPYMLFDATTLNTRQVQTWRSQGTYTFDVVQTDPALAPMLKMMPNNKKAVSFKPGQWIASAAHDANLNFTANPVVAWFMVVNIVSTTSNNPTLFNKGQGGSNWQMGFNINTSDNSIRTHHHGWDVGFGSIKWRYGMNVIAGFQSNTEDYICINGVISSIVPIVSNNITNGNRMFFNGRISHLGIVDSRAEMDLFRFEAYTHKFSRQELHAHTVNLMKQYNIR
jgi:hypothetical protein